MRTAIIMVFFVALGVSCKKSNNCDGPNRNCSGIMCVAFWSYFDFRLTDKTTGADLVFANNPRYTANDIKLYSDIGRTRSLYLYFDNTKKVIHTMTANEEMYLVIKGTDVYKLTASFRSKHCCANQVGALWQDGQMVCSCCPDAINLAVQ